MPHKKPAHCRLAQHESVNGWRVTAQGQPTALQHVDLCADASHDFHENYMRCHAFDTISSTRPAS
jgi:hypothetical protein